MSNENKITQKIPRFSSRHKSDISIKDCLVKILWQEEGTGEWPAYSVAELAHKASAMLGYKIFPHSIRGIIYKAEDLFTRTSDSKPIKWKLVLTRIAQKQESIL